MDRTLSSPPIIKPVASNIKRPLWSVMIPTYNCSGFLEQALKSVLSQDRGAENMQIEVVDDCSTDDDVEAIVKRIGNGRVSFYRQKENVGSLRNFETCLNRSVGKYVHLLHGDDYVEKGFYSAIEELFELYPEAGSACTGFGHIDNRGEFLYPDKKISSEKGILKNWLETISQGQKLQPPCVVVKRSVYEDLGGFYGMHYGEDWVMWVRIASKYPVAYNPSQLAMYRIHDHNITSRSFQSGQHIKDMMTAINLIQQYLPQDKKKSFKRFAQHHWSHYFARTSDMVYHRYKNPQQAVTQAKLAMQMSVNPTTVFFLLKMRFKKAIHYKAAELKQ